DSTISKGFITAVLAYEARTQTRTPRHDTDTDTATPLM
ncbi:hypothetical protein A2U01_0082927, partial [Trifolium medium]|nr:hypothetical protein [Trifolium medium]